MRIIIAGAGAVGTHLAKMLSDEQHDIVLMAANVERMANLDSNFDLMTIAASPTSISSLKDAGVANADLFVAVTPEESTNITACMLAQKGDVILVAGKGHENYQDVKGVKHHFDDKEILNEVFGN